jgi:hypothetical protein
MNPYLSTACTAGQKNLQYNIVYKFLLTKHRVMQEQTNQYAENKQICMQKRCMKTDVQPLADKQMFIHTRRHLRLAHEQTGRHRKKFTVQ